MKDQLTVLIPTSPIPSHPSTVILDETISNIRKYTDAEIIIMFDGVHSSLEHRRADYEKYIEAVEGKLESYGFCNTVTFKYHEHQARMTRWVLENIVRTPLIMFCEHDTSPIGEIPFREICDAIVDNQAINYIRFNIFESIPREHYYLMIDIHHRSYLYPDSICLPEFHDIKTDVRCIPITRTVQWSQRPHIAKTHWYKEILDTCFKPEDKTMIEDVMHSVVQTAYDQSGKDIYGLAIYTPEGNQLRSYHSDGRGSDEKIITG